jgi:hypothetical protein
MAKSVKVSCDPSELVRALRDYSAVSRRDLPKLVNDAAIDAAFKANRLAPKAKLSAIPPFKTGLYYALAAQRGFVKGQGIKKEAEKIHARRRSAVSYSKALFLALAGKLGAKLKTRVGAKQAPDNAEADKARPSLRPVAILRIKGVDQSHADDVLSPAMQKGVAASAAKFREKLAKKMAKDAKDRSGRRAK